MIRFHIKNSPIAWVQKHVKGHQDNHKKFAELDSWSQANVIADELAKAELRKRRPIIQGPLLEGETWKLRCKGDAIAGGSDKQIRQAIHETKMHDRWNKQFGLDGVEDEFDWDTFKRTCRSKSDWQQIWFAKHNSRIGGIRQNLVRRKHG